MGQVAWGYVRCAEGEEGDLVVGERAQREVLQAYARFRGLKLEEVFVDLETRVGEPLEARAGGKALVAAVRGREGPGGAVLTVALERLFSTVEETLMLYEEWAGRRVELHVLDVGGHPVTSGSPLGQFMIGVLRSACGMDQQASRAKRMRARGVKPLLGERVVRGYIVPDANELHAVQRIRELADEGKSLRVIAETLDVEGVPTKRRAKGWSKEAIRLILQRIERGEVRDLRRDAGGEDQAD